MGSEKQNLNDIMNAVSGHLDTLLTNPPAPRPSVLSEIDAFTTLDPLLASLHKEYLDARNVRLCARKDYGAGDGMTDMAALLEDSAWCAMQTRYMEIRADRALMIQAQKIVAQSQAEDRARAQTEKEAEKKQKARMIETYMRMHPKKENATLEALWALVFLLMCEEQNRAMFRAPAFYQFNRIAA